MKNKKNRLKNGFWEFRNAADGADGTDGPVELLIYGDIAAESWWEDDTTPKNFADTLQSCNGRDLVIRINSGGGDVFAAQAIYNLLRTYDGAKTVRIDGLAASAATVVACAGDSVIMPDNALFMIHNPACLLWDYYDAQGLADMAERLETVKQTIVNVYLKRVGDALTEEEIRQMMDAETWMTADEAQDYGFVDQLDDEAPVTNSLRDGTLFVNSIPCNISRFRNQKGIQKALNQKKKGVTKVNNNEVLEKIKNLLGLGEGQNAPAQPPVQDQLQDPVQAERARMVALDALADHTIPAVTKLIDAAKANGTTAEQIRPFVDIVRSENQQNAQQTDAMTQIRNLIRENMTSGAEGVTAVPQAPKMNDAAKRQAMIDEVVNIANAKRG